MAQRGTLSTHGHRSDVSLCLAEKSQLVGKRMGLAMVTFRWAVGIAKGCSTDVAGVVEPNPEAPAAETAGRRSFLRLALIPAHDREHFMEALAIK